MSNIIHIVNRTTADISMFDGVFSEAYKAGVLDVDFVDIFKITILPGYNDDGSDRMLIDFA